MERVFFRTQQTGAGPQEEKEQQAYRRQVNIAVTGLSRGAGTTFVGTALAFYFRDLGKETAFCQCLTPSRSSKLLYDEVAMEQRFARRNFCDVYEKLRRGEIVGLQADRKGRFNWEEKISWILPTDSRSEDLTEGQKGRLLSIPRGEICIYDVEAENQWNQFLMDMDVVLAVVDPLPSRLIHDKERFRFLKKLELSGCPVIWVVNRMNEGVSFRQVKGYLKSGKMVSVPAFPVANVYRCEYSCRFPWEDQEIRRKMMEIFTLLFQKLSKYSIIM